MRTEISKEIINLLVQYKSIIGTVLGGITGSLLTFILNQWSRKGKLKIYIYDFKENCFINTRHSKQEERETSYIKDSTNRIDCRFSMDVYNSSLDVKVMRELKLGFRSKGKEDYIISPYDRDRTSSDGVGVRNSEINSVNIQPKGITTLKLYQDVNMNDYNFTGIRKIYIQYKNQNNKIKRVVVKKFI